MKREKNIPGADAEKGQTAGYHVPVLLLEAIDGLDIKADGIYVDCTFGGGGHSRLILERLGEAGKLVAFDQDAAAAANLPRDSRVIFVPQNFRHLQRFLRLHKISQVDGILADLGVSSHQFDEAERGFSIRFDAYLDMRMDQRQEKKASDLLRTLSEAQLHKIFEQYGEVTNSKTLARTIIEQRAIRKIETINDLKQAVEGIVKGNPQKYLAQVFQALRIEVNDELGALREMLEQVPPLLKPGGRVSIITFHSLEDRMVKNFFKNGSFSTEMTDEVFGGRPVSPFKLITKKPVVAGPVETKQNPRSRSAKLRVAEKI